jgi:LuxR family transcriptional regulator, quorum-sensing system regulator BjaR1
MHRPSIDAARFARSLTTLVNRTEVWRQLKTFAAQFGFEHVTVLKRTSDLPHRVAKSIIYTDAPTGYAEDFDRLGSGSNHPLLTRALESAEPFSRGHTNGLKLTPAEERVMARAGKLLNITDGWVFPIMFEGELNGIVLLGGPNPDMSPLTCSILHLLSHAAFRHGEQLANGTANKTHGLTNREVECLRWVAQGKTDIEIAMILSISARTARFHIENAKRKLRVSTRVQAVAEALKVHAIAA